MVKLKKLDILIKRNYGTIPKFAKEIKVSNSTVWTWIRGDSTPSFTNAKKIKAIFGQKIKMTDLYPED